jgi:hypothetical protein
MSVEVGGNDVSGLSFSKVLQQVARVLSGQEEVPEFSDLLLVRDRIIHKHDNVYYLGACGIAGCQNSKSPSVSKVKDAVTEELFEEYGTEDWDDDDYLY